MVQSNGLIIYAFLLVNSIWWASFLFFFNCWMAFSVELEEATQEMSPFNHAEISNGAGRESMAVALHIYITFVWFACVVLSNVLIHLIYICQYIICKCLLHVLPCCLLFCALYHSFSILSALPCSAPAKNFAPLQLQGSIFKSLFLIQGLAPELIWHCNRV